jgi:hypothetical protein
MAKKTRLSRKSKELIAALAVRLAEPLKRLADK